MFHPFLIPNMLHLLEAYATVFIWMLIGYYLLPAGIAYYIFYVKQRKTWQHKRIQPKFPKIDSIHREIKWSVLSVSIFSGFVLLMDYLIQNGYTKLYDYWNQYGWWYLPVSLIITIVLFDTYFYWVHRFMHWKPVFKFTHYIHHRSTNPTPWAIYAFHPGESILLGFYYPIMLICLPLHISVILLFVAHNIIHNVGGHLGFEILPKGYTTHFLFKWNNVVTHHDMHHAKIRCNYSLYFNFWDRIMKTNHKDYLSHFNTVKMQPAKKDISV